MRNKRPGDRTLEEGRIFNTDPHSSKWYWAIWQKRTGCGSKNCHISDLYSTNCTQEIQKGRTKKLKTLWKVWNSTAKTGFKAGLLNFLHRVFNMWKNNRSSTDCIQLFCGKLFSSAKQRTRVQQPGEDAPAWQNISAKRRADCQSGKCGRPWTGCENFCRTGTKNGDLLANKGGICYTSKWVIIWKRYGCAVQDAAHLLEGACSTFR